MKLPSVYVFNPTGEMAVANATASYQAPKILQDFEDGLASLPAFFANKNDILLCPRKPLPERFVDFWAQFGVHMPISMSIEEAFASSILETKTFDELRPWCWSPAMHHKLQPLKEKCSPSFLRSPVSDWKLTDKEFYSRKTALAILKEIVEIDSTDTLLPEYFLPEICSSLEDIEKYLSRWGRIVLKAPWSSSGRGLQVIRNGTLNDVVLQWSKSILKQQDYLMVEPLLDKKIDFAFQFEIKNEKVNYLGTTFFSTNSNGLYQGNFINCNPELKPNESAFFDENIEGVISTLTKTLEKSDLAKGYHGYLGVDAMLFQYKQNLLLQPCLEINLRYNMGTLALRLGELIHPKSEGMFHVFFNGKGSFRDFAMEQSKTHPPIAIDKKAQTGFFPLTPLEDKRFGAYLELRQVNK